MHSSSAPIAVSFSPAPPGSRIFTRPSVHLIHTSLHNAPGQSGQRKWREENLSLVTLQADYGAEQVSQALPRGHRTRPPRSHQRLSHVKVARGVRWGPERVRRLAQDHSCAAITKSGKPLTRFCLFNEAAVARGQQCASALTQPLQEGQEGGKWATWPAATAPWRANRALTRPRGEINVSQCRIKRARDFRSFTLWSNPRTEATQMKKDSRKWWWADQFSQCWSRRYAVNVAVIVVCRYFFSFEKKQTSKQIWHVDVSWRWHVLTALQSRVRQSRSLRTGRSLGASHANRNPGVSSLSHIHFSGSQKQARAGV